ncbi:SCO6880 family protein [Ferrimicrobium sp.]|uniref:SCO6880 family protein n=1 Tax=Ferrimicrobium sp. TaxID=2926050 RepID=UPI002601CA6A|nr:SCO6880 family protein [Ferrimicrobium sp.]
MNGGDERESDLVYFGTPASGTQMLGLPITLVAKLAFGLVIVIGVAGLGNEMARLVIAAVLGVCLVILFGITLLLKAHPLAWVKMKVGAKLARRAPGFTAEAQLLRSVGSRQLIGGFVITDETPAATLRAERNHGDAWAHLLNEASNRLVPHGEMVLRSSILPQTLFEDLSQCAKSYRELALTTYRVQTSLLVTSPPGTPRRQRAALSRTITGLRMANHFEGITLAVPERPWELIDTACGGISESFSTAGTQTSEGVEMLVGERFAASTYRVDGWPGRSVDPRMLLALFAPGPPSRVVSLVVRPVEVRRAQREVARHRTEMVADRRLRRERGYLDRARDDHREATSLTQEEELLAGYRLCRYQLLVVLLAPSAQRLAPSRAALEELAASAQLRLRLVLGEQRSLFERALLGVTGWS